MRRLGGMLLIVAGLLGGLYVGGGLLVLHPSLEAYTAFGAGTLTAALVAVTVLKILFGCAVGCMIAWFGLVFGGLLLRSGEPDSEG